MNKYICLLTDFLFGKIYNTVRFLTLFFGHFNRPTLLTKLQY